MLTRRVMKFCTTATHSGDDSYCSEWQLITKIRIAGGKGNREEILFYQSKETDVQTTNIATVICHLVYDKSGTKQPLLIHQGKRHKFMARLMVINHSHDDSREYYPTRQCKENTNETLEKADGCWFKIKSKKMLLKHII